MSEDAWLRFRHGTPLSPREEEDLATALLADASTRKERLADAEMDGLLRGLAWGDADADAFVSAVAASLAGDPPFVERVREALDRAPAVRPTRRRKVRARLRGSRSPALAWIAWAAVGLVAILLALRGNPPRTPEPVSVRPPAPLAKEPGRFVSPPPPPAPSPKPTVEPAEAPPLPPAPPTPQPPPTPALPAPMPEPPSRPPVRATVAEILKIDRLHGTALLLPEDGTPRTAAAGAGLPSGAGFRVADGRAALVFPDGTRIEIHGPAELRNVQDGRDGKRLALRRGVITLDVAKQAPGAPLVVETAQARTVVLGTTLRVFAEPEATRVEVRTGRVRLERVADGRSLEIEAGYFAVATPGATLERRPLATIVPLAPGRPSTILADFEKGLPGDWQWAVEHGVAERPVLNHDRGGPGGSGALRVDSRAPGRGETSATQVYRTPADWTARRGIRLAFEGSGSGQPVRFEILDDAAERFAYVWIDDTPGWRLIEIPWGAFLRRGSGQPRGAPDDGLTLTGVQGWALSAPESRAEFRVDDVGLLR